MSYEAQNLLRYFFEPGAGMAAIAKQPSLLAQCFLFHSQFQLFLA